jgi:hypothetical protein
MLVRTNALMDLHVHCNGIVKLRLGEPHFVEMKPTDKHAGAWEHTTARGRPAWT